jgi:hypothetical protein
MLTAAITALLALGVAMNRVASRPRTRTDGSAGARSRDVPASF